MKKWFKYSLTLVAVCAVFLSACFVPEWIGLYQDSTYIGKIKEYEYESAFSMYEQAEGKEENWNLMKRLQQSDGGIELVSTSDLMVEWGLVYENFREELNTINTRYEDMGFCEFYVRECELQYRLSDDIQGSRPCYRIYAVEENKSDMITALIDKETYGIYYLDSIGQLQSEVFLSQMTYSVTNYKDDMREKVIYNQIFQAEGVGQEYEEGIRGYYNDMINVKKPYGENDSDSKKADYEFELLIANREMPVGYQCGFSDLTELIEKFDMEYGVQWELEIEKLYYKDIMKDWSESFGTDASVG